MFAQDDEVLRKMLQIADVELVSASWVDRLIVRWIDVEIVVFESSLHDGSVELLDEPVIAANIVVVIRGFRSNAIPWSSLALQRRNHRSARH